MRLLSLISCCDVDNETIMKNICLARDQPNGSQLNSTIMNPGYLVTILIPQHIYTAFIICFPPSKLTVFLVAAIATVVSEVTHAVLGHTQPLRAGEVRSHTRSDRLVGENQRAGQQQPR